MSNFRNWLKAAILANGSGLFFQYGAGNWTRAKHWGGNRWSWSDEDCRNDTSFHDFIAGYTVVNSRRKPLSLL